MSHRLVFLRTVGVTGSTVWRPECWLIALGFLVGTAVMAPAAEVRWRYDYNAARREAQAKGLPLVLDFGTANCFWCKKLDETTFQDASVLGTLNERFIPLKVDADQNAFLTETLQIHSYPTIVLAGPDGKILGTIVGYVEAGRFHDQLRQVLAGLDEPEWMKRDYQEAARAVAADPGQAVGLLRSIVEDGKERPVQVQARQLLKDLERQAAGRLAQAKLLESQGRPLEALAALGELQRAYRGTAAAAEAAQVSARLAARPEVTAQERARRAHQLLAQAREDYGAQQFLWCLDRCELLTAEFSELPEAAEAAKLLAAIQNNSEWMRRACDAQGERLSRLCLSLAEQSLQKGQPLEARLYLERAIQASPGTHQAAVAQARLAQLQGQPSGSTTFKKP